VWALLPATSSCPPAYGAHPQVKLDQLLSFLLLSLILPLTDKSFGDALYQRGPRLCRGMGHRPPQSRQHRNQIGIMAFLFKLKHIWVSLHCPMAPEVCGATGVGQEGIWHHSLVSVLGRAATLPKCHLSFSLVVLPGLRCTGVLLKDKGRVPSAWSLACQTKRCQLLRMWCSTSPGLVGLESTWTYATGMA